MAAERRKGALPFGVLTRLALRNIARNKLRSALSLAAIATGVMGLILSGGFVNDLMHRLGEALIHSQSGHLQVARRGYFEFGSRSPGRYLVPAHELERAAVPPLPQVAQAMRRISFSALLSNGRSSYPVLGEGVEPGQEAKLGTERVVLEGRALTAEDRYAAVVGAGVARALNLTPGSHVSLIAPTVDEALNTLEVEVVGTFQTFSKDYDDRAIRLPLDIAQTLLDTDGVNVLVLLLTDTRHTAGAASVLAQRAERFELEVKTWDWLNDFYSKAVALYDRQFGVLRLIVLLMVLLAVAGAINVSVRERAGEFGTMRALGNRSADVVRLVLLEGALTGTLGAMIGAALGCAAASAISTVGIPMPPPPNSNLEFVGAIRLDAPLVVGATLVGACATVLASIVPALRVARLPVAQALREIA